MPKFARPTSYNGRGGTQQLTGDVRFATQDEVDAALSDDLAVSPATLAGAIGTVVPPATTIVAGIVELATDAEAVTGTATTNLAINPGSLTARLQAPGPIGGTTPATFVSTAALRVVGGTALSNIGQVTLASGTATVADTAITANDKVFPARRSINGSTALGVFESVITPTTGFVINSLDPTDATVETADISIVDYVIVRQV